MKSNHLSVTSIRSKADSGISKLRKLNESTIRFSKKWFLNLFATILSYAILIALSGIFLAPFIYMISRSFMSAADLANINVKWLPTKFIMDNYHYAYMSLGYIARLGKSFLIVGLSVLGQVITCALVGYGLARFRLKLGGLIFGLVIFSLIIPPQTIIVSQYLMFSRAGVVNSWLPIILPCFFSLGLNGGLFVFIFRQFFRGLPDELENAAMIDGLGFFQTFFRIIIPSSASSLLVTSILSLIWQWNNSFESFIYINTQNNYSLTMMLRTAIFTETVNQGLDYTGGIYFAAAVMVSLPIILIFFLLQRRFIKGIETAGLAN